MWVHVRVVVKLCDPSYVLPYLSGLDEFLMIKRYRNLRLLYLKVVIHQKIFFRQSLSKETCERNLQE